MTNDDNLIGYLDCQSLTFTHPFTGSTMPWKQALEQGLLEGTEKEVEAAIDMYNANRKPDIMEYSVTKVMSYSFHHPFVSSLISVT